MSAPLFSPVQVQTSDPQVTVVGERAGEGPALLLLHGNPLTHLSASQAQLIGAGTGAAVGAAVGGGTLATVAGGVVGYQAGKKYDQRRQ